MAVTHLLLLLLLTSKITALSALTAPSKSMNPSVAPKLIVFDLDATLWSPELYTLRKIAKLGRAPRPGVDVKLYPDVMKIFEVAATEFPDTRLAIASTHGQGAVGASAY